VRHAAELTRTVLTGTVLTGTVLTRTVLTGAAAAVAARAAYAALRRNPPAGERTWARTNHRGEPVTLLEGPAVAVGAITAEVAAAAVAGRLTARRLAAAAPDLERSRGFGSPLAVSLAGAGALGFGVLDDLKGSGNRRGLRGHLGALAHGEVTTGAIKLAGLAATGLIVSGNQLRTRPSDQPAVDLVINAGLVAGGANLLNLFDLRPGRAIKVATLSAGLIAAANVLTTRGPGSAGPGGDGPGGHGGTGSPPMLGGVPGGVVPPGVNTVPPGVYTIAAPLGAGLALLPEDLAERAMLGDAGANALGAMLGAAAATSLPRPARAGLLAGIVALTVASEKISFTKVIERTPALHWLDMLGRASPGGAARPPIPPAPSPPTGELRPPSPLRRPTGKHRRVREGDTAVRSGEWVFGLLKTVTRQEP
jgi:UDP-GlcNAc:undecaprenyl-phosphate/decaprenyl-phosphate GlcNAc-1-phosphate transferase